MVPASVPAWNPALTSPDDDLWCRSISQTSLFFSMFLVRVLLQQQRSTLRYHLSYLLVRWVLPVLSCHTCVDPETNHHNTEMEYQVLRPNLWPRAMIHPSAHRTTIKPGERREHGPNFAYRWVLGIWKHLQLCHQHNQKDFGKRWRKNILTWGDVISGLIHHTVEKEIASDESKHKMTQQWLVSQDPRRKPTGTWRQKICNETSSWT